MKEDWERGNGGRLGKVVDKRSGYGGRLENRGGFSDLGYEVTDFDESHLQHKMEYERDTHWSAQSRHTDDAIYMFGKENKNLINKLENATR